MGSAVHRMVIPRYDCFCFALRHSCKVMPSELQQPRTPHLRRLSTASSAYIIAPVSLQRKSSSSALPSPVSLPKLPVPPLQQTLSRFLAVAKPLVTADGFTETQNLVREFATNGEGEKLQRLLEERAKKTENWLTDWWLEHAYLSQRDPLIVNVSPGLSFPMQSFHGIAGQITFASKLAVALLDYKAQISGRKLPPDMACNQPLDMSQYDLLFGTCRIPGIPKDSLRYTVQSNHIIVAYKNRFYKVLVYNEAGVALNEAQISKQLRHIVENCRPVSPDEKLGILTTENRSTWAKAHGKLRESSKNKLCLEAIETSLFLLCLDDHVDLGQDAGSPRAKFSEIGRQLLHGGGANSNSGNRWFDKTLQFIVGYDGACGMTYEHSPAEGPPVAGLMDFAFQRFSYAGSSPSKQSSSSESVQLPEELQFELSPETLGSIRVAASNLDRLVSDVEIQLFPFVHFGKDFPKSQKLSPDSFIQLALQLTFYRMHNECPAAYETGTLRRFKFGRTDTIRLPTSESVEFVKAMCDPNATGTTRAQKLHVAIASHKEYTAAACSGNGIDRHLLGLKLIAIENGEPVPKLFDSVAYKTAVHFKLSTSQVAAKSDACMLFGPMYPDCYGVCYNPQDKKIQFSVSAFNSCPITDAVQFVQKLEESLLDMQKALMTTSQKSHL